MQTANCYVHIAGDSGTTVPKYQITASEIAVLRLIHGEASVTEIEPAEDIDTSDRAEIARLHQIYSRPDTVRDGAVGTLFPGGAARAYQTLDELDIPEEFFKAESRVKPKPVEAPAEKHAEKHVKAAKGKKADEAKHEPAQDIEKTLADEDKLFD